MTAAAAAAAAAATATDATTPAAAEASLDAPTDAPVASPNFVVTGNTVPTRLDFDSTSPSVHHIYTDDVIASFEKEGGIDTLIELFLFHTCIQNDPGTPSTWKAAMTSAEREYWLKSATSEFKVFSRCLGICSNC